MLIKSLTALRKTAMSRLGIVFFIVCFLGGCFLPSPHLYEGPEHSDEEIVIILAKQITRREESSGGMLWGSTDIVGLKNHDNGEPLKIPRGGSTVIAKVLPATYEISIKTGVSIKYSASFKKHGHLSGSLTRKLDKGMVYNITHNITNVIKDENNFANAVTAKVVFTTMGPVANINQYLEKLGYGWLQ